MLTNVNVNGTPTPTVALVHQPENAVAREQVNGGDRVAEEDGVVRFGGFVPVDRGDGEVHEGQQVSDFRHWEFGFFRLEKPVMISGGGSRKPPARTGGLAYLLPDNGYYIASILPPLVEALYLLICEFCYTIHVDL